MVYVVFCVSGVLSSLRKHPPVTTREGEPVATRSLESDTSMLASTLTAYAGAVVVVGNDWPFSYDLETVRQASNSFGRRVVNAINTIGNTKEDAVIDFMQGRREPLVILASPDYEFSERTISQRVPVDPERGFDKVARVALETKLRALSEHATRPLSDEEMLEASSSRQGIHRARRYAQLMRADEDRLFQCRLRSLMGEE